MATAYDLEPLILEIGPPSFECVIKRSLWCIGGKRFEQIVFVAIRSI